MLVLPQIPHKHASRSPWRPPTRVAAPDLRLGMGVHRQKLTSSRSLPILSRSLVFRDQPQGLWGPMAALPPARPLPPRTLEMTSELKSLVFGPTRRRAAAMDDERRKAAKAQKAKPPEVLRIGGISVEGLPDADKGVGGGGTDPYVIFTLESTSAGTQPWSTAVASSVYRAFGPLLTVDRRSSLACDSQPGDGQHQHGPSIQRPY